MLGYLNVMIKALVAFIYTVEFNAHTEGLDKEGCRPRSESPYCHEQEDFT